MRLSKEREESITQRLANGVFSADAVRASHRSRESRVYARLKEAIDGMASAVHNMLTRAECSGHFTMYLSDLNDDDRNATIHRILSMGADLGYKMTHEVETRATGDAERFTMTLEAE